MAEASPVHGWIDPTRARCAAVRAMDRPGPDLTPIGPQEDRRDLAFIAAYPGVAGFGEIAD